MAQRGGERLSCGIRSVSHALKSAQSVGDADGIRRSEPGVEVGQGGIAQGLGQALYEEMVYDENGQLLTGSLMDYPLPRASNLPHFELARTETPTPVNPLGVKGIGEAGTIGSTPAAVNAVVNALAPFGVTHIDMPLTPQKIWRVCREKRQAPAGRHR